MELHCSVLLGKTVNPGIRYFGMHRDDSYDNSAFYDMNRYEIRAAKVTVGKPRHKTTTDGHA